MKENIAMFEKIKNSLGNQQRLLQKFQRYCDEANFAYDDNSLDDMEQIAIDKAQKIASKLVSVLEQELKYETTSYKISPIEYSLIFSIKHEKQTNDSETAVVEQTFKIATTQENTKLVQLDR